jgi:NAD(P)H dehydrogenase (quinone)
MANQIAVTGATGQVGQRVATHLNDLDLPLVLIARDPSRLAGSLKGVAREVPGYGSFDGMSAALDGAHTLFLVPAAETADRVDQHKTAIDAAVAAGVRRIVYLSFFGASEVATFTLARDHWHTEQFIRATGLDWTFLRMNLYMDFIPSMVQPDGAIRGPAGDGRLTAILREDVAEACAAAVASDAYAERTFNLTGKESFTLSEAAMMLTDSTRSVRFENETDEQAWESRKVFGAHDFEVRGWISSYQAIRDGSLAEVSQDMRALTGRDPSTLQEHLRRQNAGAR